MIIARALQTNATGVIVAHNHPSGAAQASESDRLFTEDLLSMLKPIGMKLLDHVIVGENSVFSFADRGIMEEIALALSVR